MLQQGDKGRARAQANKVAVRANEAFIWFTGAVWQFYRAVLAGPTELVIPEHTRDAFFQLWCDLRTNVPKDRNWVRQHATALQPKTSIGYLALASFAAFATAGGTSLLCLTLATVAALTYSLMGVAIVLGLTAGFWLLLLSGILFFSSFIIAWSATCMAAGYIFLASASGVLTYIRALVSQRRTPLQESRKAVEAVKSSVIPPASKTDDFTGHKAAKSPDTHYSSNSSSYTSSPSEEDDFPSDTSPGRAQHLLGTANVQKTNGGLPKADAAALGGPTLAGKSAEAVHPSILPDSQLRGATNGVSSLQ